MFVTIAKLAKALSTVTTQVRPFSCMGRLMNFEMCVVPKPHAACSTHIRPFSSMDSQMALKVGFRAKTLPTHRAFEKALPSVLDLMGSEFRSAPKSHPTRITRVWLFTGVNPLVSPEAGAANKGCSALITLKSLLSRMRDHVDGERQVAPEFFPTCAALIFGVSEPMFAQVPAAGETFSTHALIRLFPRVGPFVPLEVGRLTKGLSTK